LSRVNLGVAIEATQRSSYFDKVTAMLSERSHFGDADSNQTPQKNVWFAPGVILAVHDHEIVLDAPDGVTKSINVQVEMEPKDGGCLIWGTFSDGVHGYIEVRETGGPIDLPFVRDRVYLNFLPGTTGCKIKTLGWRLRTAPFVLHEAEVMTR
jgi:hypothetical protein